MSDNTGPAARRALPPRDEEPTAPGPRRLAAADDADLAGDLEHAPRRSAASPAEPSSEPPDEDPPADDPSADPAGTPSRRLGVVAGVVAVVAVLLVVVLWLTSGGGSPVPGPTPTPTLDRATLLAEPSDLAGLRAETTWAVSTTATKVGADTPQPRCLALAAETDPRPQASWVRTLAAEVGDPAAALHQLDHHATAEDAARAWEQRLEQLGVCAGSTAWLTGLAAIEGTSDQAVGATYVLQNAQPEFHTIVVSRTGSDLNILDLTSATQPWPLETVAAALTTLGQRQCGATAGTCPTTPLVTERTPPVTTPAGWLAPVDLPRLTLGAGTWQGTDVAPLKLPGAACEAVDLAAVPGATAQQRTYLVDDDPRSTMVGVDQAVYTFATPDEASALASTLTTNIDGCPGRTATATVQRTGETGLASASGASWRITQKVNGDQTASFRVAVVASGTRVLYVFANPTPAVDFTDADWQAVVNRAAGRLAQLP